MDKAVKDAYACRISTPRQGECRYTVRRGSGLFISDWAFGDACRKVNSKPSPRFFVFYVRHRGAGGCVPLLYEEKTAQAEILVHGI